MTNKPADFATLARHFELPRDIALKFGELHSMDPKTAESLLERLQGIVQASRPSAAAVSRRGRVKTNVDAVVDWFEYRGNQMATKAQIAMGTGLTKQAVHTVVYGTGKDLFETKRGFQGREAGVRLRKHEQTAQHKESEP